MFHIGRARQKDNERSSSSPSLCCLNISNDFCTYVPLNKVPAIYGTVNPQEIREAVPTFSFNLPASAVTDTQVVMLVAANSTLCESFCD